MTTTEPTNPGPAGPTFPAGPRAIAPEVLALLRCPVTGQALALAGDGSALVTPDGSRRYPIRDGLPLLTPAEPAPAQA